VVGGTLLRAGGGEVRAKASAGTAINAQIASTVAGAPSRRVSAASTAPSGGVACISVRSNANNRPCTPAGVTAIRSVCAQVVIAAAQAPNPTRPTTATHGDGVSTASTAAAATSEPNTTERVNDRRQDQRSRISPASNSPAVVAATR
jgi:hypothetical protein